MTQYHTPQVAGLQSYTQFLEREDVSSGQRHVLSLTIKVSDEGLATQGVLVYVNSLVNYYKA